MAGLPACTVPTLMLQPAYRTPRCSQPSFTETGRCIEKGCSLSADRLDAGPSSDLQSQLLCLRAHRWLSREVAAVGWTARQQYLELQARGEQAEGYKLVTGFKLLLHDANHPGGPELPAGVNEVQVRTAAAAAQLDNCQNNLTSPFYSSSSNRLLIVPAVHPCRAASAGGG